MDKKQKLKLELARDKVDTWAHDYDKTTKERDEIRAAAAKAIAALRNATFPVKIGGITYRLLLLGPQNQKALNDLARFVQLPPYTEADKEQLHQLDTELPTAIRDVLPIITPKLASKLKLAEAEEAAEFLLDYVGWGLAEGVEQTLARIKPGNPVEVNFADVLQPSVGLRGVLASYGSPELLPVTAITTPLATFTAAEKFPELARTINNQHEYVVVCSPPGSTAADLIAALK